MFKHSQPKHVSGIWGTGMLAVYDLGVSPPTFDFIGFLVSAERQRIRSGEKSITVAIVSGPNAGFRQDDLPPHDPAVRRQMLDNVVKPMCQLLPTCVEVIEMGRDAIKERMETIKERVFPLGYHAERPLAHYGTKFFVTASRAKILPLMVNDVKKEEGLVVITLRQSEYWPTRNSNIAEWLKVAHVLKSRGKRVVFVPDTANDGSEIEGFEVDRRGSFDLIYRVRQAASAELNLSVNNGPAWVLAMMPQVTSLIFKMVAVDAPYTSPKFCAANGLPIGSQLDRANHKIVWADDNADIILNAIDEGFPAVKKSAA